MSARWLALMVLGACRAEDEPTATTPPTTTTPPDDCVLTGVEAEIIDLTTRDGVRLEADRYAGLPGEPGLALFHMIPPSNTRADYPSSFLERFVCRGWSVVNVDRRGAGGSDGTPADSYTGPGGAFDVEAAVGALEAVGAEGLGLIGASNGTTSALDYAVLAGAEGLTAPDAVAFLTGGGYTENQNALDALPPSARLGLFYSDLEDDWSEAQRPLDPGDWSFHVYADGGHGTQLFATEGKAFRDDLEGFFAEVYPSR